MSKSRVLVNELPERTKDCPFFEGYPNYKCTIGGGCTNYSSDLPNCRKLMSMAEYLHTVNKK